MLVHPRLDNIHLFHAYDSGLQCGPHGGGCVAALMQNGGTIGVVHGSESMLVVDGPAGENATGSMAVVG